MRRVVRGAGVLAVLGGLGVVTYVASLVRSLDTPEFKARVTRDASAALGAKVEIDSLSVSLMRGISLDRVRIQNPPGFKGDLFAAESARLSYDPWALLTGRIRVDELTVRRPVISLAEGAGGTFNYRRLSGAAPAAGRPSSAPATFGRFPALVISKLSVEDARLEIADARHASVLRLDEASIESALAMEGGILTGTGEAEVESVVLANALFLRRVRAPLKLTKDRLDLAPLKARLAGGDVTGSILVAFKPDMRYALKITTRGADLATLLKEAGSAATMTGSLDAEGRVEGTGSLITMKGDGRAEIKKCRWAKSAVFGLLSSLLQVPELADPRFDDCRVEFVLSGGEARTPLVSLAGPALELKGGGVLNLSSSALDYDLTLALSKALLAKVPGTLRAGFKVRPDGFGTVAFRVTGTTAAPRTDLAARVGKAAAIEAAKGGLLERLFGKKK